MLGRGFGFGNNNSNSSPFGSTNNSNNTPPAFGAANNNANRPFGSTNSFGNPSTPSASTTGFGGFGTSNQQSPFGTNTVNNNSNTGSSLFASKPATTSPFGSNQSQFGSNTSNTSPFGQNTSFGSTNANQQNSGTGVVPFQPYREKDPTKTSVTSIYQSITAMPQYRNFSFEELRYQDYQQNRRYGNSTGNLLTTNENKPTSPFGTNNTTGNMFGSNQNNTSPFGQTNTSNTGQSLFSKPSSGSLFGTPSNTGNSVFGNTNNTGSSFGNTASTFGQSNQNTSPFGQNSNTSNTNAFGSTNTSNAFGLNNTNNAAKPFGSFGSNTGTTGTSLFGNSANNTNNSGGLFSNTNNNTTTTPSFGSGFGQNTGNTANTGFQFGSSGLNTNNNNTSSGFGATNKPAFTFGQTNTNTNTNTGTNTGIFGNSTTNTNSSPFGQTNTTTTTSTTSPFGAKPAGGFSFGQATNPAPSTTTTVSGPFGSTSTNTTGGLFAAKPAASAGTTSTTGGGLFGAQNTGTSTGGLFGGNSLTAPTNNNTGFSLSSNTTNSAPSLFGNNTSTTANTNTGTSLFGNSTLGSTNTSNTNTTSGGLFGNRFSSTNTNTSAPSTGLFSGSLSQGQQQNTQQPRVAQIDQQPFGNNPLFQSQPSQDGQNARNGPLKLISTPLSGTPHKKKQANLVSARVIMPRPLYSPGRPGTPRSRRHRDDDLDSEQFDALDNNRPSPRIGSPLLSIDRSKFSPTVTERNNSSSDSFLRSIRKNPGMSAGAEDAIIQAQSFTPRSSIRRLIIDRTLKNEDSSSDSSNVLKSLPSTTESTRNGSTNGEDSIPSPQLKQELEAQSSPIPASTKSEALLKDEDIVDENGYWISPRQEKLKHMALKELRKVSNFKVGRKGAGQVEFLEPVDLSNFSDFMSQIPGRIIVFSEGSCVIYPDESSRPPIGQQLNVKVKVAMLGVWPRLKDSLKLVKDANHPIIQVHIARLKKAPNAQFVSYDASNGSWTFIADPI